MHTPPVTDSAAALRFMLLSAFSFAAMAAAVKAAAASGIPVLEIVAARALISLILSYLDLKRRRRPIWGTSHRLLLARGGVGALALVCVYYAVSTLPLAEATLLQFTYPAFTALLALLCLGERIRRATLICIVMSLIGVALMVLPHRGLQGAEVPLFSVGIALLGALGSAVAYVLVRRLSQSEDPAVIIFYFPLVALPLALLLLGSDYVVPDGSQLGLLLLVGIFTQLGQIGLTRAMALEQAARASAYSYVQVVFSALLGVWLFNEIPGAWSLLGGGLIIAGALVNSLSKR